MKEITYPDLQQWKTNSIDAALKIGLDNSLLTRIRDFKDVSAIRMVSRMEGDENFLFGYCLPDVQLKKKSFIVGVFPQNLSCDEPRILLEKLSNLDIPDEKREEIINVYHKISPEEFFDIYNQSGMDHELIGHGFNYLKGNDYGEHAACSMQLALTDHRSENSENWREIRKIIPIILEYVEK